MGKRAPKPFYDAGCAFTFHLDHDAVFLATTKGHRGDFRAGVISDGNAFAEGVEPLALLDSFSRGKPE
jgi:hypothetical protein